MMRTTSTTLMTTTTTTRKLFFASASLFQSERVSQCPWVRVSQSVGRCCFPQLRARVVGSLTSENGKEWGQVAKRRNFWDIRTMHWKWISFLKVISLNNLSSLCVSLLLCLWLVAGCRVAVNVVIRLSSHPTASPRLFFCFVFLSSFIQRHSTVTKFHSWKVACLSVWSTSLSSLFPLGPFHLTKKKIGNKKTSQRCRFGCCWGRDNSSVRWGAGPAPSTLAASVATVTNDSKDFSSSFFDRLPKSVQCCVCVCVVFWASELCVCAIGNL